mmetsp:Transcript_37636/g.72930  ORF Transcript_37636/g.72930 Transcript_37636/m.72930 type:complete len:268 (-) Transcript_37636:252-1055(-)
MARFIQLLLFAIPSLAAGGISRSVGTHSRVSTEGIRVEPRGGWVHGPRRKLGVRLGTMRENVLLGHNPNVGTYISRPLEGIIQRKQKIICHSLEKPRETASAAEMKKMLDLDGDGVVTMDEIMQIRKSCNEQDPRAITEKDITELEKELRVCDLHVDVKQIKTHEDAVRVTRKTRFYNRLVKWVDNPWIGLLSSVIICGGALFEAFEAIEEGLNKAALGLGVLALGHFLHYFKELVKHFIEVDKAFLAEKEARQRQLERAASAAASS